MKVLKLDGPLNSFQSNIFRNSCINLNCLHEHDGGKSRRKNGVLPKVEQGQALARLQRSLLEQEEAFVVFLCLELLVVKVLDGLVVDERIDGFVSSLIFGSVHLDSELGPPLRDAQRVGT